MAKDFAKFFYKSQLWQDTRQYILKRDNYMCQSPGCYSPASEVHHIIRLSPENIHDVNITVNPTNLISLCGDCHKAIHKGERAVGHKKNKSRGILPDIIFDENGFPIPVKTPPGGGGGRA